MIDASFKIDTRAPIHYREPKTAVSSLVQMPLYQITVDKLMNAYMKDFRQSIKGNRE